MPTNLSGRFTLIAVALLLAVWAIFPRIFKGDTKPQLKPGIDMVGGTSLLYEIKAPAEAQTTNLAEQVMEALKKRVDPDGVRNLIWRPQGNNRLEIQMPLSKVAGDAKEKREAYATAQRKLESLVVRTPVVLDAVKNRTGDERRDRLNALAMGNNRRAEIFGALASLWDQIKAAEAARDVVKQGELENQFESLVSEIDSTNLPVSELESILAMSKDRREQELKSIKDRFTTQGFAKAVDEIDQLTKAYDESEKVRGSIEEAGDLKRLLKGSGVLEFHIVATPRPAI
jgi:SecD/SecF fusion protein